MIDTEELKVWFESEKRDLPWRIDSSPYAVWVSEMMLQQTQVATVIPYFIRWMKLFPTIEILAAASLDLVLKVWEGLGYYSRARSLHAGANYIVKHFGGQIPSEKEQLEQIKGLGPYTIGAIQSFAFHKKVSAVDGNVIRVLSRQYKIEDDVQKASTIRNLRSIADSILPEDESWIVNEALIELGATLCQRKARCERCPIQKSCLSYTYGVVDKIPYKSKKIVITPLYRAVAIIQCKGYYLIGRGKQGKIMSDLYEFPYFEIDKEGIDPKQLQHLIKMQFHFKVKAVKAMPAVFHSFTRYQVRLDPVLFSSDMIVDVDDYEWKSLEEMHDLAFSSGHRRILHMINET